MAFSTCIKHALYISRHKNGLYPLCVISYHNGYAKLNIVCLRQRIMTMILVHILLSGSIRLCLRELRDFFVFRLLLKPWCQRLIQNIDTYVLSICRDCMPYGWFILFDADIKTHGVFVEINRINGNNVSDNQLNLPDNYQDNRTYVNKIRWSFLSLYILSL